jgi:hypothetical protein
MRFLVGVIYLSFLAGCNGNGHVDQKPFVVMQGDDVINCACNLTFDEEHCTGGTCYEHFSLPICIPPWVRTGESTPDYGQQLDEYCRQTITDTIYHLIDVWDGSWCGYKAPFAPDGGVGSSVACFAQPFDNKDKATARDDGTCDTECPYVVCDFSTNCHDVTDPFGNVDLNKCKCSKMEMQGICPGDDPAKFPPPQFCRPPDGVSLQ